MASGVSSPWGDSPQIVAGMNKSLNYNNSHLTGQLSLTSTPAFFNGNGDYVSPLSVQNASYYSYNPSSGSGSGSGNGFGKKKNQLMSDIRYLKKLKE
jgi:hypothetical protein